MSESANGSTALCTPLAPTWYHVTAAGCLNDIPNVTEFVRCLTFHSVIHCSFSGAVYSETVSQSGYLAYMSPVVSIRCNIKSDNQICSLRVAMENEIACYSKTDHRQTWYTDAFVFLWPWPWPDALDMKLDVKILKGQI